MEKKKKNNSQTKNKKIINAAELFDKGSQAQAIYDYPAAIELYTTALAVEGITSEMAYEILDQRAECYERMGQFTDELDDLDQMVEIAQDLEKPELQVGIVFRQVFTTARKGENSKVSEIAEAVKKLEKGSDDYSISAAVNLAVGYKHWVQEEKEEAQDNFDKALRMYRAVGDRQGEANTLSALSSVLLDSGNQTLAGKYSLDALAIWRSLGNRKREASALNAWSLTASDYAQKRDAGEEALEIFKTIGYRWGQGQMYNNLSLLYGHLGLYSTARDYAMRAVEMVRGMGALRGLALYLDSYARAEMNLGEFSAAEKIFKEGQQVAKEIKSTIIEGFDLYGLGRVALMSGEAEKGREAIQSALDTFRETNLSSDIPSTTAWLGAAYLALDDPQTARMHTAESVTELETLGIGGSEYPPQEIWWWHYQALTYEARQQFEADSKAGGIVEIPENAWAALKKAREITLEGIVSLSDEGLRRNYINKVSINRTIIAEWAHHAAARGLNIEANDSQPGNVQAQLQRQLAIGVRMNERREIQALTEFIMDELIELSGSERAMLLLVNESGERYIGASYGFTEEEQDRFLLQSAKLIDSVEVSGMHDLRQDIDETDINGTTQDPQKSLSVLCVPLISGGKSSGVIYADNHAIYGKFTQADVDLLASFANQVSAALENAHLYQGLEQRVTERTAELSTSNEALGQRNAELGIINSVQDGLATKLDFQDIIDLVGTKIQEIFGIQNMSISILDRSRKQVEIPFYLENGKRFPIDPWPFKENTGVISHVLLSKEPVLVHENFRQFAVDLGSTVTLGDEDAPMAESVVMVPILVGGESIGTIGLFDHQKNKFEEPDLRLLTTLASSMGVALDNARLFDQTNRLLDETQRRSAELAIINSVQEALASKLEFQSVIDFVGDKLRDVLGTENIDIRLIDKNTEMVQYLYMYEHGERFEFPPAPIAGISKYMVETQEPLVIIENLPEKIAEIGSYTLPGTKTAKSLIAVPFTIREDSIGVIIVEDYEKEHAFSDSDLNLLTTLAASMSVALENARLFDETNRLLDETQQRSAELAIINSVQEGLAEELDIPSIFELVGEKIREIFDAQVVLISTFDYEKKIRTHPYHIEKGVRTDLDPSPFNQLTYQLVESRKQVVINQDMATRAEELGMAINPGTEAPKSLIFVPMIVGDTVMGSVSLQNVDRENAFPESAVRLLNTMTSSMSVALENARLFDETNRLLDETQQRNAELTILNSVGDAMAQKQDVDTITRIVGDKVRDIFKAESTSIHLYNSQDQIITTPYGYDRGYVETPSFRFGEGLTSVVIETRQPLLFGTDEDAKQSGSISLVHGEDETITESYIGVPIIVGDRVLGVVSVQSYRKHAYDESSVRLLSTLATSMGVAIENARLFEETNRLLFESQQQAAEMATVNTVGKALTSELEMDALIELIGEQVRQNFSADITYVALYDRQTNLIEFPYAVGEDLESMQFGEGLTSKIIESAEPLLINEDVNQHVDEIGATHTGVDVQSYLGVPILVGKQAIGVISVQSMDDVKH
ncbi:MAG: GAF domain-containing protein, partial [Anaerolineales bacterium]|nr:GAF domain-containing protein [Anaerolineales bacterium]